MPTNPSTKIPVVTQIVWLVAILAFGIACVVAYVGYGKWYYQDQAPGHPAGCSRAEANEPDNVWCERLDAPRDPNFEHWTPGAE